MRYKKRVRRHYAKLARQAKRNDAGCAIVLFIFFSAIAIGTKYIIEVIA